MYLTIFVASLLVEGGLTEEIQSGGSSSAFRGLQGKNVGGDGNIGGATDGGGIIHDAATIEGPDFRRELRGGKGAKSKSAIKSKSSNRSKSIKSRLGPNGSNPTPSLNTAPPSKKPVAFLPSPSNPALDPATASPSEEPTTYFPSIAPTTPPPTCPTNPDDPCTLLHNPCTRIEHIKCCRRRPPGGLNPDQFCRLLGCDLDWC